MTPEIPIATQHLFATLDAKLLELLRSLTQEEWHAQTVAKLWKVKDVAAHLLDGNIRLLSIQKERYYGEAPPDIDSYNKLVNWLNRLNADWVKAAKRISPAVMLLLHEATGKHATAYYESLDPFDKAVFAVSWAGEAESLNWFHIAREYTEKWLHQQQIRDAVNKPGIINAAFFRPFIHTCMYALPYTYRHVKAAEGTIVQVNITTDAGGHWAVKQAHGSWKLVALTDTDIPASVITIDPDTAWKLFSKSLRAADIKEKIKVSGNEALAVQALEMVAVMA